MVEMASIMTMGIVSLALVAFFYSVLKVYERERRDMLDRVQSSSTEEYIQRKWAGVKLAEMAQVSDGPAQAEGETVMQRRPWEHDPEYQDADFHFDHENNTVEIIDGQQELHRVEMDLFLARYR